MLIVFKAISEKVKFCKNQSLHLNSIVKGPIFTFWHGVELKSKAKNIRLLNDELLELSVNIIVSNALINFSAKL